MNTNENTQPVGTLRIELRDKEGKLIEVHEERNLIVNVGKQQTARLLGGDTTGRSVDRVGVGIGTSTAAAGDTALTSPVYVTASVTYPTQTSVQFAYTFDLSTANGLAITEFGLVTVAGNLYSRRVRSAINKDSSFSISGTWTIQF